MFYVDSSQECRKISKLRVNQGYDSSPSAYIPLNYFLGIPISNLRSNIRAFLMFQKTTSHPCCPACAYLAKVYLFLPISGVKHSISGMDFFSFAIAQDAGNATLSDFVANSPFGHFF